MRNWLVGLVALSGVALAAPPNASAQGVVIGAGPGGVGVGVGWGPGWYDYGPYGPGPGIAYYAPGADTTYYGPGYTPPPYAYWGPPRASRIPRDRMLAYRPAPPGMLAFQPAPPAAVPPPAPVEAVTPTPGQCGTFFYWSTAQGRCVDARLR